MGKIASWSDASEEIGADYDNQTLILDDRFHPYVEVYCGEHKASAVWDTGAGITVVDIAFIADHPDLFQEAGASTGTDATGLQVETPMFMMAASMIGMTAFPACKVAGVDLSRLNASISIPWT